MFGHFTHLLLFIKNKLLYLFLPAAWTFCVMYLLGYGRTFTTSANSHSKQLLIKFLISSSLASPLGLLFPHRLSFSFHLQCLFSPSLPSRVPRSLSLSPAPRSCSQSAEFCSAGRRISFILQLTVIHQRFTEAFFFHSALSSPLPPASACFTLFAGPTQALLCFLRHDPPFFDDSPTEWHIR